MTYVVQKAHGQKSLITEWETVQKFKSTLSKKKSVKKNTKTNNNCIEKTRSIGVSFSF